MKNLPTVFAIVLILACLSQVVADIYLASLPFIADDFAVSVHMVQLSLFFFMLGLAGSQLFYGSLADALGRKRPLILGLSLCLIGSLTCLYAHHISVFNLGRLIQGIGAGAGMVIPRSIMRDIFSGAKLAKTSSYLSIASIAIVTGAPFLGSYLQHWFNWQASFVFVIFYTVITIILIIGSLPETGRHQHIDHLQWHNIRSNIKQLLSSIQFVPYVVIISAAYACVLSWLTAGSVLLQKQYHLSPTGFGWLCLIIGGVYAIGSLSNARLLNHYRPQQLLKFGISIIVIGSLCVAGLALLKNANTWTVFIPVLLTLCGVSFIMPNAYACAMTPFGQIAGTAGALASFAQITGGVLSSGIISLLPDHNALPMGMTMLVFGLIALYALRCSVNSDQQTLH